MVAATLLPIVLVLASQPDPYVRCPLVRVASEGPEVRVGMPREQVEALVGKPERTGLGAPEYLSRGFALMYDDNDRLAAVLVGQSGGPGRLSEAFTGSVAGIAMGTKRSEVESLLGKPDEIRVEAGLELLKYTNTGLVVSLAGGRVYHLSVSRSCARPGG